MAAPRKSVLVAMALVILAVGVAVGKEYNKNGVYFTYPDTWSISKDVKDDSTSEIIVKIKSPSDSAEFNIFVQPKHDPMTTVDTDAGTHEWIIMDEAVTNREPYQENLIGVLFKGYRITDQWSDGRITENIFIGAVVNDKAVIVQCMVDYPRSADDEAGISLIKSSLKVQ